MTTIELLGIFFLTILVLILTLFTVNKLVPLCLEPVSYPEIEGLRGYLALGVFFHHARIWYDYLRDGNWDAPDSNLFNQLGQTSVVYFFIITAFLFTNKIMHVQHDFNWKSYIRARFYRLAPAYYASISVVFMVVAYASKFSRQESVFEFCRHLSSWLLFTVDGPTDLNQLKNTFLINAGVTWSLVYEWLFYLFLPLLALLFKKKVSLKTVFVFTMLFAIVALINQPHFKPFLGFFAGIASAIFLAQKQNKVILTAQKYSLIGLILSATSVFLIHDGQSWPSVLISGFIFVLIAAGNNFFGFLSLKISRKFGQIAYSLYLIHGLVLFITFKYIIGFQESAKLSKAEHWIIIIACMTFILLLSQLSFKYIELPYFNKRRK